MLNRTGGRSIKILILTITVDGLGMCWFGSLLKSPCRKCVVAVCCSGVRAHSLVWWASSALNFPGDSPGKNIEFYIALPCFESACSSFLSSLKGFTWFGSTPTLEAFICSIGWVLGFLSKRRDRIRQEHRSRSGNSVDHEEECVGKRKPFDTLLLRVMASMTLLKVVQP